MASRGAGAAQDVLWHDRGANGCRAYGRWANNSPSPIARRCRRLFYGNMVEPFPANHGRLADYFERLKARPSVARVIREAEPYFAMVPKES